MSVAPCNDVARPRWLDTYARDVATGRKRRPLTAGGAGQGHALLLRVARARGDAGAGHAARASNVLLVQKPRALSTPYSGALKTRAALGDRARTAAVDSGGHGAYPAEGSDCGDRLVTRFLTTGQRPGPRHALPGRCGAAARSGPVR